MDLSGMQRSLLALSLVLALLKYKPAPMYILDEIDAALDLSHTQNIGTMIKQHFPEAQFIVVSLKDGMLQNANVLFRTRFIDGCSRVERHTFGANAAIADAAPAKQAPPATLPCPSNATSSPRPPRSAHDDAHALAHGHGG